MDNKKINVGILFGGRSAEHEVSLQSAKNVIEAIDKEKYNPILIGIDKQGKWLLNDQTNYLLNAEDPKLIKLNDSHHNVALIPEHEGRLTSLADGQLGEKIDVVFPVLHGTLGEDGTVQGLLKLAGIPFVGAGVLGSAVGMDKDVMKRLLRDAGIPIPKFMALHVDDEQPSFDDVINELGRPFFVKPANMGSSVGITRVNNERWYHKALKEAFKYDTKILIEEYITGREIECAVLGNHDPMASVPGEVTPTHDFYSYEAKYIDEKGAYLEIPAQLDDEVVKRIQGLAIQTFRALCCEGMGRVDFFVQDDEHIVVNEINTIPGFTAISMYPQLMVASGVSYTELIDRLIGLALERSEKASSLQTSFSCGTKGE